MTDATGAVVPGATVTATNLGTNEIKKVQSGAAGEYRFVSLLPAAYKVTVEANQFKLFVVQPVVVQVDSTTRVDAPLQPGAATETVEVTSEAALLQTESGTVGSQVEGQTVQAMPLNGRNAMNLVALTPGVVPGNYTSGSTSFNTGNRTANASWSAYQIGGGFSGQNVQYVDGSQITMMGGGLAMVTTQDAIQEFKVNSSAISPEFGRFAGGVIEMTTKSGTNTFHGSAYEYVRNTLLNANAFFSKFGGLPRAPFHQNQFGLVGSGPLLKNKAFVFGSWEKFILRQAQPINTNVPTAAERGEADPSGQGGAIFSKAIFDNSTKACPIIKDFPTVGKYYIPKSCFDATTQVMKTFYPLPNATLSGYNYSAQPVVGDDSGQYNIRGDYSISENQRLFVRYAHLTINDIGQNEFNNYNGWPTGYAATHNWSHLASIGDTYTFSPTLIGDFRANYARQNFTNPAPGLNNVDMSKFGPAYATLSSQVSYRSLPNVNMSGSHNLYNMIPISVVQFDYWENFSLNGSLTKILNNHTIKVGAEALYRNHSGTGNFNTPAGLAMFTTASTGDELAAYMMGEFSNDPLQTIIQTTEFNKALAFYGVDTWKVTRNLTINAGLRWDLPGGHLEKKDRNAVLLPDTIDPNTGLKGAVALVNSSLYPSRSVVPYHYNHLSPRLSFAQTLPHNTVIRGGYALSFLGTDQMGTIPNVAPINAAITTTVNSDANPTNFMSNPFPNGILTPVGADKTRFPAFDVKLQGQNVALGVPDDAFAYMQQWNLSLGKQWDGGWQTDISYVGARGTHLAINGNFGLDQVTKAQADDLQTAENAIPSTYTAAQRSAAINALISQGKAERPYPQFQNLSNTNKLNSGSSYNGMYLVVQKRFKNSGLINVNFTWYKQLSDTDAGSGGGTGVAQNYYDRSKDRTITAYDIPRRFVTSYVLPLPFGKGQKHFANAPKGVSTAISGWTVNGIATIQAGLPLSMQYNGNYLSKNLGSGTIRPNYVPGCDKMLGVPKASFDRFRTKTWFNAACFTYPGDFSFGNAQRVDGAIRAPGMTNFDLSMAKSTQIWREMKLDFRAEAFNLFNHPYLNRPGATMAGNGFNDLNQQNNPPSVRLLQLSMRLNF